MKRALPLLLFALYAVSGFGQCIESMPYFEDFSSSSFVVPATDPAAGSIPTCWTRSHTAGFYWRPDQGTTGTFNSGPSGDKTTGSGKYLVCEADFSAQHTLTSALTPYVDLSSATSPEVRFWRHMFGFQITNLIVQVQEFGSTSWTNIGTFGSNQTSSTSAWTEGVGSLAAYAGDTIRLRFVASRNSGFGTRVQTAIDDILIAESTTCAPPNNLNVQSKTATSVTLNWFTSNSTPSAEIRYVEAGQPISSATIINTNSVRPFTVTGLNPSTTYLFWVRDSCQTGQRSPWIGPLSETTVCGVVNAPWTEGFESTAFGNPINFNDAGSINPCWIRVPSSNGYLFYPGPGAFTTNFSGPSGAKSGTKWIQADRSGFGANTSASFRSPQISLSPLTNPELSFWYHMYGSNINKLEIEVKSATGPWTLVRTINGQQQSSKTQAWEEDVISLSSFANNNIFIRFTAYHSGSNFNAIIALDDVSVREAPPCPRPNPFTLSSVTSTSATFAFTSGGTSPWQIEYGTPGFTPGSGTLVTVTTNPATITGLTPQTSYDFYIRDTCGTFGVSQWTGPVPVTTDCAPTSAPYVENFDGSTWSPGTFGVQGTLDPCWSATDDANDYFWTPSPPAFVNANSGPQADHTTGVGDYLYTDGGFFGTSNDTALAESPLIDLSPLTTPELTFWYHMFGANISSLRLYVDDGTGWQLEWSKTGQQQTGGGDAWKEAVVNLSSYAGSTIKLRFVGKRTATIGNQMRIAIDDVDIHEEPPCPKPTQLSVGNATLTTLDVSWNTAGGSAWIIEYGPSGFPIGTGTTVNTTASPTTITGLLPSTTYDVYIYNDCGTNGTSDEEGPESATTLCGVVPAPFTETFESPGWVVSPQFNGIGDIESCWFRSDTVNYVWKVENKQTFPTNSGPTVDHTTGSGKYAYTDDIGFSANISSLRTPEIDLAPLDTPELRFWYYMYGNNITSLQVQVREGGTTGWSTVRTISGQQQTNATQPWQESIVDLSAYTNKTVFIRFVGNKSGFGGTDVAIDDIRVDEKPNCPGPSNLTATGVSESSIEVSWTSGGGTTWLIEYGPAGFIPGTGTTISVLNNPYIVTGLNTNTAYDFYVQDSCTNGGVSWSEGPATGITYPCPDACLYELKLEDQFSNGWSVGTSFHWVDIVVDGTVRLYTLRTGGVETFFVPVCDSSTVDLNFRSAGFGTNQVGFELRDADGVLLYDQNFGSFTLTTGNQFTTTAVCNPVCNDPVGLTIQNIGPNSADAFWSSISGDSQIAWGTAGFTPGTPNQSGIASGQAVLTGLTPNTTYDVYIQDTCDNGLLSGWVGPVTFTTVNCAAPSASFTFTTTGLQASFDGSTSSANATTYTWDYGDGNNGFAQNTANTYTTPGIYTVQLIVANACGDTDTATQQVVVCGAPSSVLIWSTSGLDVNLDASTSAGIGNSYSWDFGDGNNGTGAILTHSYGTAGTYNLSLFVTDTCGTTDTLILPITVCDAPVASFTYTVTGFQVDFDASASANATQFFWDFDDGNTANGVNVSNTYAVNQNYDVILYAINACGDTISDTQTIALCSDPKAEWTYTVISSGGNGMLVQFDATASIGNNYWWDFGDGQTATGTNFPTHLYAVPGLFYRVTLVVSNDCGDDDTLQYRLSNIGLEEEEAPSLIVYPNPNDGSFVIDLSEVQQDVTHCSLEDMQGRTVYEHPNEIDALEDEVAIQTTLNAGVYVVRIRFENGTQQTEYVVIR
ncbi:PKD domain-containing protein [Phaeocystidibacter luteus]|uniref:PKD domain-containing protein n=1 Tax=Phaeocystidibacter luteus TaxID=911197 RepID=UPI0014786D3D|nr:PKD domain-containing protein [Phaeocystidibacter luteus]